MTMPRVKKAHGGGVLISGVGNFTVGDEADVDEETAEYLVDERGDFEYVDEEDAEAGGAEFDEDGWLDQGYEDRVDAVEAGEVDEHLDEISEVETSETVVDAVEERKEEL